MRLVVRMEVLLSRLVSSVAEMVALFTQMVQGLEERPEREGASKLLSLGRW